MQICTSSLNLGGTWHKRGNIRRKTWRWDINGLSYKEITFWDKLWCTHWENEFWNLFTSQGFDNFLPPLQQFQIFYSHHVCMFMFVQSKTQQLRIISVAINIECSVKWESYFNRNVPKPFF